MRSINGCAAQHSNASRYNYFHYREAKPRSRSATYDIKNSYTHGYVKDEIRGLGFRIVVQGQLENRFKKVAITFGPLGGHLYC